MGKQFQYIDNFKAGDTVATMRLNKAISSDPQKGITGEAFSREHDFLVSQGVKSLLIPINSVGGNVFQGLEIFATIQDSPMETETRVVGIAASMAGVISQAGNKRTIKEHALFHAHSPRPEAGKSVGAEMLTLAYNQLKTIFIGNTSMNESKVDEMLSSETFLSSEKGKSAGLFDEILPSSGMPEISAEMDALELMNVFNKVNTINNVKMKKVNLLLSLSAEAGEESAVSAISELQAKAAGAEKLRGENAKLTEQLKTLNNSLIEANKAKATTLVDSAIKSGKIDEKQKEIWIENAVANFESTSLMIEGIKGSVASKKIMDEIDNNVEGIESRKDWGFEEWSKNDPEGLKKMQTENSAAYLKMFDAYIAS